MHAEKKTTGTQQHAILGAAMERFRHFGYNKTTMAEIAADVEMSPANLYRFFRNKEDIAAECALMCLDERATRLTALLAQKKPATELLQDFVIELLRYTREQAISNPRINELVNTIAETRHDIIVKKNQGEQEIMEEILRRGAECGEFDIEDIQDTARSMHKALFFFQIPLPLPHYSLEVLEELAYKIVDLFIHGIARK